MLPGLTSPVRPAFQTLNCLASTLDSNFQPTFTTKGLTKLLVQQVPQPAVHAILHGTHLVNLKHVRSIVFEESRRSEKLERRRWPYRPQMPDLRESGSLPPPGLEN